MSIRLLSVPQKDKPKIYFTPTAWCKIRTWVEETKTQECAMEGVVAHTPGTNIYVVNDMLVYPQMDGSSGFVTTNDQKYMEWSLTLSDEIINNKRFQMHSHVKMQPNPSSTDIQTWERLMAVTDDYMIFMIMNIQNDFTLYLYDKENNLIYDKEEIETDVLFKTEEGKAMPAKDWYILNREQYITKQPVKTGFNTASMYAGYYDSDTNMYNRMDYSRCSKELEAAINKVHQASKDTSPAVSGSSASYCHIAQRDCFRKYAEHCALTPADAGYCNEVNGYCQVLEKYTKKKLAAANQAQGKTRGRPKKEVK